MAKLFTPAPELAKLNQCEILKSVAQIGVDVGVSTAGAALTSAPVSGEDVEDHDDCELGHTVEAAVDRYQQVIELPKFKESSKGLKYALYLVGVTNRKVWTMYPKLVGAKYVSEAAESDGGQKLSLETSTAEGVCGHWFGVGEEDNNKGIESVKKFITSSCSPIP